MKGLLERVLDVGLALAETALRRLSRGEDNLTYRQVRKRQQQALQARLEALQKRMPPTAPAMPCEELLELDDQEQARRRRRGPP